MALAEEYFLNMHGLRCLGFIHKPSFMEQLKSRMRRSLADDVLLHAICALGAKLGSQKSDLAKQAGFRSIAYV
jgi:hypothetical protein